MKNNIIKFPINKKEYKEDNYIVSKEYLLKQREQIVLQQKEILKQREKILEIIND